MSIYLDDVNAICSKLKDGQIVLCPTDTIWGLSCDATNPTSVEKIYQIKDRDRDKPLILLVDSLAMLRKYASNIHPRVEDLIIHYNKPLTVIHKASHNVPSFLMNKDQTIAIRLTQSDLLQEIINGLSRPIVSTSANRQGDSSPACFQEIKSDIIEKVDYVCQSDRVSAQPKAASQIIRYTTEGELIFLR